MATNRVLQFSDAYQQFLDGRIGRRALLARAAAVGIPAALATRVASVVAQDSTPAPDFGFTSITTADAMAQIQADYPMTDPASSGGVVIIGGTSGLTGTNIVLAADAPTLNIMNLVNESLVGPTNNGRVVVGFVFGRWARPQDLTNLGTPLGTDAPRVRYVVR